MGKINEANIRTLTALEMCQEELESFMTDWDKGEPVTWNEARAVFFLRELVEQALQLEVTESVRGAVAELDEQALPYVEAWLEEFEQDRNNDRRWLALAADRPNAWWCLTVE